MRVLIVNTSEKTGGAAVAANRLSEALNNNGVKAKMLVGNKETDNITVVGVGKKLRRRFCFLWERWCIYLRMRFSREHLFSVDMANAGVDITSLREFKEADLIHLNWTNQGFLSIKGIRKILESGKPVVWTMHDFWASTAICHYPRKCRAYRSGGCHHCPYLPGGGSHNDLSSKIWRRKMKVWKSHNIIFVTCSRWLASAVKGSGLLAGKQIVSIPNPIDTREFCPADKCEARMRLSLPLDKKLVLVVSQRVTDKRKGMEYLVSACDKLAKDFPDMKTNTEIVILGGQSDAFSDRLAFGSHPLGYVSDTQKIVDIYNAVDLFVLPSLEDNLPNTIMEAMACGVPCVGFNTGGIPEMIDHLKNGYVATSGNVEDLANGIRRTLFEADYDALSHDAVRKVSTAYSQQIVALKYIEVYNQAMAYRHYRL